MISVCIPYYERQDRLNDSIMKYEELYDPDELEIIVVDDRSPTPCELKTKFKSKLYRLPPKPHTQPLNPCVPINLAVSLASCNMIVLTGPEVVHRTPVFYQMVKEWETPFDYISASVFDHERGYLTGPQARIKGSRAPYPDKAEFPFCALLDKRLFRLAGGYDPEFRFGRAFDDNDFLWRLYYAGAQFKSVSGVVYHVTPKPRLKWNLPSNEKLFRQKWADLYSS